MTQIERKRFRRRLYELTVIAILIGLVTKRPQHSCRVPASLTWREGQDLPVSFLTSRCLPDSLAGDNKTQGSLHMDGSSRKQVSLDDELVSRAIGVDPKAGRADA